MARSEDIASFTEHRQHLREHFHRVQETGRPLFITAHGRTAAVVLSPQAYDALADKAELARSLEQVEGSLEDVKKGRTRRAKSAIHQVAKELGLTVDR